MKSLLEIAALRGLSTELLSAETWPEPAPHDAGLNEALSREPLGALDQLRRRGLQPELVSVFWSLLEKRPVELGLFAWDVLSNSLLLADDEVTLRRMRDAARAVREVLPSAGGAWADTRKVSAADLVRAHALPAHLALTPEERRETTRFNALGALEATQMVAREHGRPPNGQLLEAAHQFARYLHLAHLSTLATFYLDYLAQRCEYQPALPDWVDAMADAGGEIVIDRDRVMKSPGIAELELANFAVGRAALRKDIPEVFNDGIRKGPTPLNYTDQAGREAALKNARSTLLVAHSFLVEKEQPVPFDLVNEIVRQNPGWRYAGRVRLAYLAHVTPKAADLPLKVLDQFLATFGNDADTWKDFDDNSEPGSAWLNGSYARVLREVTTLPHDRAAWEGLGIGLGYDGQKKWETELLARITAQCKLD